MSEATLVAQNIVFANPSEASGVAIQWLCGAGLLRLRLAATIIVPSLCYGTGGSARQG
ncbi:MAG: hypothetical protein P1U32_05945 [Legionellaceae bacterium]|nr:hypothetical protein [Legionellaceae bacterium]